MEFTGQGGVRRLGAARDAQGERRVPAVAQQGLHLPVGHVRPPGRGVRRNRESQPVQRFRQVMDGARGEADTAVGDERQQSGGDR
ncbi:hypothetical protein [Streptomyces sp. SID2119]|uniref:hypothetical protein n=1 Tax=Streptomyces sp. SID2119 TaxID=2690253 RepID=UPI00136E8074|nr:hypothetical protein [Streptomyces sp. SID2119]